MTPYTPPPERERSAWLIALDGLCFFGLMLTLGAAAIVSIAIEGGLP